MSEYGTTKTEAARAELDGFPASLPGGNRWKYAALDHRWGKHYAEGCPTSCPHFGTDNGIESAVETET